VNAKRKGTRNEQRSIRLLEASGYAVMRAAASLGAWDLVGIGSADVVLCQVKTRGWPGAAELERFAVSRRRRTLANCSIAGAIGSGCRTCGRSHEGHRGDSGPGALPAAFHAEDEARLSRGDEILSPLPHAPKEPITPPEEVGYTSRSFSQAKDGLEVLSDRHRRRSGRAFRLDGIFVLALEAKGVGYAERRSTT
jgi:hypothetical protein